jgi:hypothetical protein
VIDWLMPISSSVRHNPSPVHVAFMVDIGYSTAGLYVRLFASSSELMDRGMLEHRVMCIGAGHVSIGLPDSGSTSLPSSLM